MQSRQILEPICDLKRHIFTNKYFNCILYSRMLMISIEFHTHNGNLQLTAYSLQEMSALVREMFANQGRAWQT